MERVRIIKQPSRKKRVKIKGHKRANKRPNRKLFTNDNVLSLPAKAKQYSVWDAGTGATRGLSILVSPAGAKTYRSTFYFPGSSKPHTRKIGRVGQTSLKEARAICQRDREIALKGFDPKAGDPTKSDTFAAAVEEYIKREQIGRRGNLSIDQTRRVLKKDTVTWHTRPVATIRPEEIDALLERVRDGDEDKGLKPRPYLANSLHSHLRTFFTWCVKPNIRKIEVSPMIGITKPWNGERRRVRAWFSGAAGDDAIRALWAAAESLDKTEGDYLKLLVLTGKRKTALATMQWQEIDTNWFWNAPQSTKKNKRLHPIPLPTLAQRILHPRKATGAVFPGADDGHVHVNGDRLQRKIIEASGLADYFHHGVRHLVESKLAEIGIAPHVRDLLLDHRPNRGSGAGYDHHQYRDEMRAALEAWAAHVVKLAKGAASAATLLR